MVKSITGYERPYNRTIQKNKNAFRNYTKFIDKAVEDKYTDLFAFNIPHTINSHKNLNRKELYELFVQYKTLLKLSIAVNCTIKNVEYGIDWITFHKGVAEMCTEDKYLAQNIFRVFNETRSGFMSFNEFIRGMLTIRSDDIGQKIDMFFKVFIKLNEDY